MGSQICSLRFCQLQPEIKEKPRPELCALLVIAFLLANKGTRWHFKGHSHDVGRTEFGKNLSASPFHEDPPFRRPQRSKTSSIWMDSSHFKQNQMKEVKGRTNTFPQSSKFVRFSTVLNSA
jgi:hypothetical protein